MKKQGGAMLKTIAHYYKKEWRLTAIMLFLIMIIVSCAVMFPLLTQQMIMAVRVASGGKEVISSGIISYWGLSWVTLIYISLGVIITYGVSSYIYDFIAYIMGKRIEISLRNRSLESLVRQDISYYSNKKIGSILTKVISDTQIVGDQAVQVPLQFGISFFEILASAIMMFIMSWQLAAITMTIFLLIMIVMAFCYLATRRKFHKVREVITEINGNVTDRVATIRLIKSNGTENYETDRFHRVHQNYYKKSIVIGKIQSFMLTTMWAGIFVLQFSVIIFSMILFGGKSGGVTFFDTTFIAFTLAQQIMIGPLFQIMNALFGLSQATVAAQRVDDTINVTSILDPHYNSGKKIDKLKGKIIFDEIEFRYPEKPKKVILPKFSFVFEEGKSYAFVGETGSGKSTIAKLLLRFYDPSEGKIIINDNINLKDINLESYLAHIGYVEQEPQILYGDVYENIRYGCFGASDNEVMEAAKKAELHELVLTWPDGYDTILGERGFMLSGGQKQRLVIARMFLKNPKVLILDEATSALDNIVEQEIQQKLDDLMRGRTTISIAHRLSTIKNCDEIVVLGKNGQGIVQRGDFETLKKVKGHFQNLYKAGLME